MADSTDAGPLPADRRFFAALLNADAEELAELLADDFLLIDVMRGGEISRPELIEAVRTRQVLFETIEVFESRERRFGNVAIVTGHTGMRGRAGEQAWAVRSRYTHVYARQREAWRLVSAQGTQIPGE
jgi:ketosteroid isomerase-like protein